MYAYNNHLSILSIYSFYFYLFYGLCLVAKILAYTMLVVEFFFCLLSNALVYMW